MLTILLLVIYTVGFGYAYDESKKYTFTDLKSKVNFIIYIFLVFIFSPAFILMDIGGKINTSLN